MGMGCEGLGIREDEGRVLVRCGERDKAIR